MVSDALRFSGPQFAEILRVRCAGRVLLPQDAGYDEAVRGYVLSVHRHPAVVLQARDAADIAAAVEVAARASATVGVLSAGHAARRVEDADLLIATGELRGVTVNPASGTARAEAGASCGEVLAATAPFGLAPVCGSHASVGAVGFALGGGIGPLGREYGFAADRVRSFEAVTADGSVVFADAEQNADLFHALRGAGRQGIAIVTAMTIDLVPAAQVFGGSVFFEGESAREVFAAYAAWTGSLDTRITSSIGVVRYPDLSVFPEPLRGRTVVQVEACHTGSVEDGAQMRQTIEHWAAPILVDLRHRPLDELLIDAPPAPGWGGAVALSELTPRLLETVLQAVGPECESPFFLAQIRHLGGELADAPGRSGSVAGRGAEYLLFLASAPSQELIDGPVPHLAARVFKSLAPWSTEALPSNFADHLDRSRREGSWPERVRADVREVQRMRDPAGMFRHWAGV